MFRAIHRPAGRPAPSGSAGPGRRPRRKGSRGRLWRSLLAIVALLGSFGATAVFTAGPASAATTLYSGIQLRGVAANCLTAEALAVGAKVTMRTCGSVPSSRQNWNIIQWEDSTVIPRRGLASSGNTALCMGTQGNSTATGSLMVLLSCEPGADPSIQWQSADLTVGPPRGIRDRRVSKCLDVQFVGAAQGTPVWLWDCNNDSNAQIWLVGKADYSGRILGHGNQCLTTPSAVPANGDLLSMEPCTGGGNQSWVKINGVLMLGGRCLEVKNSSLVSGTPAQMWTCLNVDRQRWSQLANGSLKNALPTRCLDVAYAGTTPGTQAWVWDCNASYAQGWYLSTLPGEFMVTQSSATQLNAAMFTRLASCRGMVVLTLNAVHIVAMKDPAPYVIPKSATNALFSRDAAAAAGGWANRAAINGQFFDPSEPLRPFRPQGDIYRNGVWVNDNPYGHLYEGFYVAADRTDACAGQWRIGPQGIVNPFSANDPKRLGAAPPRSSFAMGGARPLIIDGQKWGTGNDGYVPWHPNTGNDFGYYEGANKGKPTIGVRGDGIVMMMVQEEDLLPPHPGRQLSQIRDAYALLGFRDAIMFDGSISSTLAVNGTVRVHPTLLQRDIDIPYGFGMASNG